MKFGRVDIDIFPFEAWHLMCIRPRPQDAKPAQVMQSLGKSVGPAYTAKHGERWLFCCGMQILWPGVAEVWSFCDIDCEMKVYAYDVYLQLHYLLLNAVMDLGIHRCQGHVRADWKTARRFAERLGFKQEGVLKKYGQNGEDYILYARVT